MKKKFRKGNFELLAHTEMKVKGNRSYGGISAGIQENGMTSEGVVVLLNDLWYCVEVEFWCSALEYYVFKFSKVKVCVYCNVLPY